MNGIGNFGVRAAALMAALAGLSVAPAQALELEFFDGDVAVSISHSLSYGATMSLENPNTSTIYGGEYLPTPQSNNTGDCPITPTPGDEEYDNRTDCSSLGLNTGPNDDNSKLGYGKGQLVANQFKGVTDINVAWGEFSAFARLLYFYDYETLNRPRNKFNNTHYESNGLSKADYGAPERTEFNSKARDEIGADFRTLGLNVAWDTYIGDHPLTVRVGEQVINWGQSTFLPGIGLTNPVDLVRLSAPGFELRELFKPVGMAFMSFGITENIAVEGYYQYEWQPVILPPGGSFYAVNDYTGAGVNDAGFGRVCLDGTPTDLSFHDSAEVVAGGNDADGNEDAPGLGGLCVDAGKTQFADNGDEFGLRVQMTLPWLNYTQFSLYAIRYNNRLPHVGADRAGIIPNAGDLVCAAANSPCPSVSQDIKDNPGQYPLAAVKYLEDMWAYGLSWSSNLPGGWSFAGEVSLKKDFPMQTSLPELIGVAGWLDIFVPGLGTRVQCSVRQLDQRGFCGGTLDLGNLAVPGVANLFDPGDINLPTGVACDPAFENCDPYCATSTNDPGDRNANNTYTGNCAYNIGAPIGLDGGGQGYVALDMWQTQFTLIKLFPQALWSDNLTFVFEGIAMFVADMPKSVMFEKTDFSDQNNRKESKADDWGWGWRALFKLDYTSLFGSSWNVSPILVLFHDVQGSPPANSGTFLEGRKQAILALNFDYQSQYTISLKYGWFGGARNHNVLQDRDSLSLTFGMTM